MRDETGRGFADEEEVRLQAQRRINLLLTLTCISGLGTLRLIQLQRGGDITVLYYIVTARVYHSFQITQ